MQQAHNNSIKSWNPRQNQPFNPFPPPPMQGQGRPNFVRDNLGPHQNFVQSNMPPQNQQPANNQQNRNNCPNRTPRQDVHYHPYGRVPAPPPPPFPLLPNQGSYGRQQQWNNGPPPPQQNWRPPVQNRQCSAQAQWNGPPNAQIFHHGLLQPNQGQGPWPCPGPMPPSMPQDMRHLPHQPGPGMFDPQMPPFCQQGSPHPLLHSPPLATGQRIPPQHSQQQQPPQYFGYPPIPQRNLQRPPPPNSNTSMQRDRPPRLSIQHQLPHPGTMPNSQRPIIDGASKKLLSDAVTKTLPQTKKPDPPTQTRGLVKYSDLLPEDEILKLPPNYWKPKGTTNFIVVYDPELDESANKRSSKAMYRYNSEVVAEVPLDPRRSDDVLVMELADRAREEAKKPLQTFDYTSEEEEESASAPLRFAMEVEPKVDGGETFDDLAPQEEGAIPSHQPPSSDLVLEHRAPSSLPEPQHTHPSCEFPQDSSPTSSRLKRPRSATSEAESAPSDFNEHPPAPFTETPAGENLPPAPDSGSLDSSFAPSVKAPLDSPCQEAGPSPLDSAGLKEPGKIEEGSIWSSEESLLRAVHEEAYRDGYGCHILTSTDRYKGWVLGCSTTPERSMRQAKCPARVDIAPLHVPSLEGKWCVTKVIKHNHEPSPNEMLSEWIDGESLIKLYNEAVSRQRRARRRTEDQKEPVGSENASERRSRPRRLGPLREGTEDDVASPPRHIRSSSSHPHTNTNDVPSPSQYQLNSPLPPESFSMDDLGCILASINPALITLAAPLHQAGVTCRNSFFSFLQAPFQVFDASGIDLSAYDKSWLALSREQVRMELGLEALE